MDDDRSRNNVRWPMDDDRSHIDRRHVYWRGIRIDVRLYVGGMAIVVIMTR